MLDRGFSILEWKNYIQFVSNYMYKGDPIIIHLLNMMDVCYTASGNGKNETN